MNQFLSQLITDHPYTVYAVLAILAPIHGPIFSTIGGAFIRIGLLSFPPLYIALIIGDLIGDTIWYLIGRHFGYGFIKRFGHYFSITENGVAKVKDIFHKHKDSILITSKLTMGFGFALVTLFTAGLVRIPFRRYILLNAIGQIFWTLFLIGAGYMFGELYVNINNVIGKVSLIAFVIMCFVIFIGFGKYLGKKYLKK